MRLNCLLACVFAGAALTGCKSSTSCSTSCTSAVTPAPGTIHGMDDLVRMNRCELENLYRNAEIGCPPSGVVSGRAIINPGSKSTVAKSQIIRVLWQGKVITDDMMVNRVFGILAVHARVSTGESYLDGKPSVIMDYAETSKLFPDIRDEVREIAPGLYLGMAYKRTDAGPELKAFFTLDSGKK